MSTAIVLLALIPCLLLWLARHSLEPLWPAPVEEIIFLDDSGDSARDLVSVRRLQDPPAQRSIARGRPHSLICVELDDGQVHCGYLLGVRDSNEEPIVKQIPESLQARIVEFEAPSWDTLVLATVDEQRFEIPAADIRWLIYPNRLAINQRAVLAWQRFAGRMADRLPNPAGIMFKVDSPAEKPSLR